MLRSRAANRVQRNASVSLAICSRYACTTRRASLNRVGGALSIFLLIWSAVGAAVVLLLGIGAASSVTFEWRGVGWVQLRAAAAAAEAGVGVSGVSSLRAVGCAGSSASAITA